MKKVFKSIIKNSLILSLLAMILFNLTPIFAQTSTQNVNRNHLCDHDTLVYSCATLSDITIERGVSVSPFSLISRIGVHKCSCTKTKDHNIIIKNQVKENNNIYVNAKCNKGCFDELFKIYARECKKHDNKEESSLDCEYESAENFTDIEYLFISSTIKTLPSPEEWILETMVNICQKYDCNFKGDKTRDHFINKASVNIGAIGVFDECQSCADCSTVANYRIIPDDNAKSTTDTSKFNIYFFHKSSIYFLVAIHLQQAKNTKKTSKIQLY